MADRVNRKEYHQSLPKKRISAGCLFFDRSRRLLIAKPTYKMCIRDRVTGCAHLGVFLERPLNAHLRPQTQ